MTSAQAMDEVLRLTEETAGKTVLAQSDDSLRVHATIRIARGTPPPPAHLILYRPDLEPEKPYLVAFQCGFLLRLFQTPPEHRFDLAGTPSGKAEIERQIHEHFARRKIKLPDAVAEQTRDQFYNGLLLQLRSVPIGMRIDAWIHRAYPSLRDLQRGMAVRQINENAAALRPDVRDIAPALVYAANVGMNAAFAAFWARLMGDDLIASPYRISGHLATGEELLKLLDDSPDDPIHDRALIEAWGRRLKMDGWFTFLPHA